MDVPADEIDFDLFMDSDNPTKSELYLKLVVAVTNMGMCGGIGTPEYTRMNLLLQKMGNYINSRKNFRFTIRDAQDLFVLSEAIRRNLWRNNVFILPPDMDPRLADVLERLAKIKYPNMFKVVNESLRLPPVPSPENQSAWLDADPSETNIPSLDNQSFALDASPSETKIPSPENQSAGLDARPSVTKIEDYIVARAKLLNEMMASVEDIRESQKEISMTVATTITEESQRLEAALVRYVEDALKADTSALWARTHEEIAEYERLTQEHYQEVVDLLKNVLDKDLHVVFERLLNKELSDVFSNLTRAISPTIEKTISSAITESFQRCVDGGALFPGLSIAGQRCVDGEVVSQFEKTVISEIEATVARQIQILFQTYGNQALEDKLKSYFGAAFEMTLDQVKAEFQKGIYECNRQAVTSLRTQSQSAFALRNSLNSISSLSQALSRELVEAHNYYDNNEFEEVNIVKPDDFHQS